MENKLMELIKEYTGKSVTITDGFNTGEKYYEFDGLTHFDKDSLLCEIFEIPNCGCGDPLLVLDTIKKFLTDMEDPNMWVLSRSYRKDVNTVEEGMMLFMLYWLDSKGFTEHGSTVYCSWMTPKGFVLFNCLNELLKDE